MTHPLSHTLKPAGAAPGDGSGEPVLIGPNREIVQVTVDVTQITDPLILIFETALSTASTFVEVSRVELAAAGPHQRMLSGCQAALRVRWTVAAPASFAVTAIAQQVYSNTDDLQKLTLPASTLAKLSDELRAQAVLAATDEAASHLGRSFELPLTSWGLALRLHSSNIAGYHAMRLRGFNPDADPTIRMGYTDALAWLDRTAPSDPTIIDSDVATKASSGYVVSDPPRGWGRR